MMLGPFFNLIPRNAVEANRGLIAVKSVIFQWVTGTQSGGGI